MIKVLHLIQCLSRGGAARAMLGIIKYSKREEGFSHEILSILPAESEGAHLASELNIRVHSAPETQTCSQLIGEADIVQVHWWNNPNLDALLRTSLPPSRLIGWFHVGGNRAPQVLSRDTIDYFDIAVACSPYTYKADVFRDLPEAYKTNNTAMIYGAADFEPFQNINIDPHETFNIGYIGTVDYVKMHRDYFSMSAKIKLPNVRFVIAGSGGALADIYRQAEKMNRLDDFCLLGYQDDITHVLKTLDVYGYPLCEETYAASELNLQEVMYCGIPPVVFPYGGIRDLVVNNYTGLIVNSPHEYKEAIEYLYYNPIERVRIGQNAHEYAKQIFGAEIAGKSFNELYRELMLREKSARRMAQSRTSLIVERALEATDIFYRENGSGVDRFIHSLGKECGPFVEKLLNDRQELAIEREFFASLSHLMGQGIIPSYANYYSTDLILARWSGLLDSVDNPEAALKRWISLINQNHFDSKLLESVVLIAEELKLDELALSAKSVLVDRA